MRAKKQVVVNREYNAPVEYTFSEKGITLEQNGESKTYEWEQIERAVVTPKTISEISLYRFLQQLQHS